MKISKALKLKNKKVAEYTDLLNKMLSSNSSDKTAKKNYNSKELYKQVVEAKEDIVRLKTAIHKASAPVRSKIFEIGEVKNLVNYFNRMSTVEGVVKNRSSYSAATEDVYVADFSEIEKVELVKGLQERIETLQEELDSFNATTEVEY